MNHDKHLILNDSRIFLNILEKFSILELKNQSDADTIVNKIKWREILKS